MYSCTVLIPIVKEFEFLKISISQIKKFDNKNVLIKIIIADQTDEDIHDKILQLYENDAQIKIMRIKKIDCGYPIDKGLEICESDYFCSLDCDAFPISDLWLYLPIKLIEKFNFSFVGKETHLQDSYVQFGNFMILNNFYRISKTNIAKEISKKVGFVMPINHNKAEFIPEVKTWTDISCDNGVVANLYCDINDYGDKLSLKMNRIIGETPGMGVYGMIIEDLVFHMVFGYSESWITNISGILGDDFINLKNKVQQDLDTEIIINHLLELSKDINFVTTRKRADLFNNYSFFNNKNKKISLLNDDDIIVQYINKIKNREI